MKRSKFKDRLIIFFLSLPLLLLSVYLIHRYITRYETVVVTEDAPCLTGVSIVFSEPAKDEFGLPILPYTVSNNSGLEITQNSVHIETKRSDGAWEYRRRTKEDPYPGGGAIEVPPSSLTEGSVPLHQHSPGTYRLAWEYFTSVNFGITYYTSYAEFTVS